MQSFDVSNQRFLSYRRKTFQGVGSDKKEGINKGNIERLIKSHTNVYKAGSKTMISSDVKFESAVLFS